MKAPFRTPDLKPKPNRPDDAHLASAFFDLETMVGDLKCMAALLDMAAEDTVFTVEGDIERHVRERANLTGYRLFLFTKDQEDGLDYALRHTYDLIQALYARYYAGFEADGQR